VSGANVVLDWDAPDPASGMTYVRVLRRLNVDPADAEDPSATVVFFGTATTTNDPLPALLPSTTETSRTYHYAAFGCTAGGTCEGVGSRTSLAPTVVQTLRAGGYVLHWRHAAATVCQDQTSLGTAATTSSPDWWKSCDAQCPPAGTATARQMDATGVTQATTIGQQFDALAIPVGRVLSSEFCRNVNTAVLMDFGPAIEQRPDITFFVYDEAGRCDASYALLAETPAVGTNTAVIGHAGFTCPILETLAWGEVAIFKPDGAGGSTFVTRVVWDAWDDLP
jgi:phosphohistidine phosphatase SixA